MAIVNNETQGLGELFIRELDNNTIEKVIDKNGIAKQWHPHCFLLNAQNGQFG